MSDENIENNQEENKTNSENQKRWWKKIVGFKTNLRATFFHNIEKIPRNIFDRLIIFLVILSCCFVAFKGIDKVLTYKYDPIVPRKYQKEIYNLDKGQWIVVEDELSDPIGSPFLHLLPDGNVLILGESNTIVNTVDIFDTTLMKIIKRIPLKNNKCHGYNSTSLKNGNVFVSGGRACLLDSNKRVYFNMLQTAEVFDSKIYEFKDVKNLDLPEHYANSILLNNGHVLLIPPIEGKLDTHLIYNPEKNEYYRANSNIKPHGTKFFRLANGDVIIFNYSNFHQINKMDKTNNFIYKIKENKFETYEYLPVYKTMIQLDKECYLTLGFTSENSKGAIYNIKTKKLIPVKNRINRTRKAIIDPHLTLLKNGNVLILGVNSISTKRKDRINAKPSAYIYDKKRNIFYEIPAIPYLLGSTNSIMLKNGNILVAGGLRRLDGSRKLFVYKY